VVPRGPASTFFVDVDVFFVQARLSTFCCVRAFRLHFSKEKHEMCVCGCGLLSDYRCSGIRRATGVPNVGVVATSEAVGGLGACVSAHPAKDRSLPCPRPPHRNILLTHYRIVLSRYPSLPLLLALSRVSALHPGVRAPSPRRGRACCSQYSTFGTHVT
jgi:hypothetical protein